MIVISVNKVFLILMTLFIINLDISCSKNSATTIVKVNKHKGKGSTWW